MRIGEILKDGIYGAGGAIGTRVIAGVAQGFVPGAFASSPLAAPIVQAGVAVTAVRWLGKKFLGQRQGDIMMVGGLVSAGLALADAYFPNIQSGLTSVLRAPITAFTPQTALPAQIAAGQVATAGALGDVEDVPLTAFNGFADVEDVVGLGM